MSKAKIIETRTAGELFAALGIPPAEGAEIIFRSELNLKIIQIVKRKKVAIKQLAKLAGGSQKQISALLNRDLLNISTDRMLQVLYVLGYQLKLKTVKTG